MYKSSYFCSYTILLGCVVVVVAVLDVLWESTFVYMAAMVPQQNSTSEQPVLVYVTCPKAPQQPAYHNMDDVCFGGGTDRLHKYFFSTLPEWYSFSIFLLFKHKAVSIYVRSFSTAKYIRFN